MDTPIILLTAKGLELDLDRLREDTGIVAYLPKPFSPIALAKTLAVVREAGGDPTAIGRMTVFVTDLEGDRTPFRVSRAGGAYPFWSAAGDQLHYVRPERRRLHNVRLGRWSQRPRQPANARAARATSCRRAAAAAVGCGDGR